MIIPDFDPVKHVYRVNGKKVPGVTEVLKSIGITKEFSGVDPFYRDRGIASHAAIDLYLHDDLDETSLDPVCVPYLEGFKKWWVPQSCETELMLYSEKYGFAGTMDLVLEDGIYDYKCSKDPDKASDLQGLMYQWLVLENRGKYLPFEVLQLPGDGTCIPIPQSERGWDLLDAIMRLYQWKVKKRVSKLSVAGTVAASQSAD